LAGSVLRVGKDGYKFASGGDGASPQAKKWLSAHYGQGARRDDALRAAMTPVMRVAPPQSWTSDPDDTENALRGRFEYPIEAGSVHGKGTLVRAKADDASIAYEVEAAISCVPGCNGAGADILKGTIRVKGTADGPTANWTRFGSFQDAADVSVTLPGQKPGEQSRRLAITDTRRVARTPLEDRSATSWAQSASAKIDRRDYDGAIADATKAIEVDAKCADAWFNRARAKAGKRDAAGAVEDYTRAIEMDPKLPGAYVNRGIQKRALGDVDAAIADYSKAIEVSPRYAFAFRNRGVAKAGKGDFEGAIADYDKAIEIRPKYFEAYNDRGLAHYNRREYPAAVDDYAKAMELAPKEALYVVNRANAKAATGDLDGALADHDAAIALDPSNARAYYFRADVRGRKGDKKGALADYDKAIELDPKWASNWNDRGVLRQDQGDVDGAIADFTKATELDPRDTHAWFNRARSKSVKGDLDGAIADCTKAVEIDPKYAAAFNRRAGYRRDIGDDDGALVDWTKAVEADPRYATAHFSVARARFAPGLPVAPAVAEFRKSLENNDDTDYERLWLCLARSWSGEGPAAAKELADYAAARKSPGADDWYVVLVGLLTGAKTEDAAIAAAKTSDAKTSRERLCEATFYAGMLRAIRGDAAKAVELLDRCLATDVRTFTEFEEARRWRPALLLGATTRAVDASAARRVVSPDPRGPLAVAGVRDGDEITAIDGGPLTPGRLDASLLAARPGTTLNVEFSRAGVAQRAAVTLGAWQTR
jgi:tetratricopeptide (TPR) repeat protein